MMLRDILGKILDTPEDQRTEAQRIILSTWNAGREQGRAQARYIAEVGLADGGAHADTCRYHRQIRLALEVVRTRIHSIGSDGSADILNQDYNPYHAIVMLPPNDGAARMQAIIDNNPDSATDG